MKLKYVKYKLLEVNIDNTNVVCRWFIVIQQNGLYDGGGQVLKDGANNWAQHDGLSFCLAEYASGHGNRVLWQGNDQAFTYRERKGKDITYGGAAVVNGIGIQAETDHTSVVMTEIDWGQATRNDGCDNRTDGRHYIWGSDKNPLNWPKAFYSY